MSQAVEVQVLNRSIWNQVASEFKLPRGIEAPYIWTGSPGDIFNGIESDLLIQTGQQFDPQFRTNYFRIVDEGRRVGLTMSLVVNNNLLFPGIILTDRWSEVISHPDRIVLQENINSALIRTSPIYSLGNDALFLASFGSLAYNVRDILVSFAEAVGSNVTEIMARKLNTKGEYLEERDFLVDHSGKAIPPSTDEEKQIEQKMLQANPSGVLYRLIMKNRHNPAKDGDRLFFDWHQRIASKLQPHEMDSYMNLVKRIKYASDRFNSGFSRLVKVESGEWQKV